MKTKRFTKDQLSNVKVTFYYGDNLLCTIYDAFSSVSEAAYSYTRKTQTTPDQMEIMNSNDGVFGAWSIKRKWDGRLILRRLY